ncbi:hypothetical protein L7F22_016155, partial [Adiantum nelumboides]|nr:hypothetical protein [Adiantum nelumboides]
MENGSLDTWLFCKEGEQQLRVMSWERRYNVALGTARGLAYLHEECPKPSLHFDVKPQNILLDRNLEAKLADFGLAKLVAREQSSVMTVVRGTPGYIAPESLLHFIVSKKCDVYSFGMVLELVSGRRNVGRVMGNEDLYFPKWAAKKTRKGNIEDLVDKRLAVTMAEDPDASHREDIMEQVRRVVTVALLCIQGKPEMRPSMTIVCGMIEGSIALPEYIPAVSDAHLSLDRLREENATIDVFLSDCGMYEQHIMDDFSTASTYSEEMHEESSQSIDGSFATIEICEVEYDQEIYEDCLDDVLFVPDISDMNE